MDQRRAPVIRRQVLLEPGDDLVDIRQVLGLRGAVLLGPARQLAGEIVAGPAEIAEADGRRIDHVQGGERRVHRVIDRRALLVGDLGDRRVPDDPAIDEFHHVEGGADDALVLAEDMHLRHGNGRAAERLHHAIFAVDGMGGLEELPRRLLAQHGAATRMAQHEGRVRLPAGELLRLHRPAEARPMGLEIGAERRFVDDHGGCRRWRGQGGTPCGCEAGAWGKRAVRVSCGSGTLPRRPAPVVSDGRPRRGCVRRPRTGRPRPCRRRCTW